MSSTHIIKIQRRSPAQWAIWLIVVLPFVLNLLSSLLPFLSSLKYVLDLSWLLLLLNLMLYFGVTRQPFSSMGLLAWVLLFLSFTFFTYWFHYQSLWYYLWGARNNFRYYIVFFACIVYLRERDIRRFLQLFDRLFWINAVITAVQYLLFGKYGDWLGGIFGTEKGCNSYTNQFFCIYTIKTVINTIHKTERLHSCIAKLCTMSLISAIAEIKFYYIELIVILAMVAFLTGFTWRKLLILSVAVTALLAGSYLLVSVYASSEGFLSVRGILDIAASGKGYTSSGDLNRLTAIPVISRQFLKTVPQRLFGYGLGNCDTSGFAFLITPFYRQHSHLHYLLFSTAILFLELGYAGLIFYFGFFLLVFVKAQKMGKEAVQEKAYCQMAALTAVCCVMISIYNSSMRTEAGYMAYFMLSLPFVRKKSK